MNKKILFSIFLLVLIKIFIMPTHLNAQYNMGTINLKVGQTAQIFAEENLYYTVAGSWSQSGSSFRIYARSQRSCRISGSKPGTSTLIWKGFTNARWIDSEMYWTINVTSNGGEGGTTPQNKDDSGSCGDNLTYTFKSSTNTLSISGTGSMYNYGTNENNRILPWVSYQDKIKKIVINSGVTTIGANAFSNTGDIEISIPNTVTTIGDHAFERSDIKSINFGNGVSSIGIRAFADCISLSSIPPIGNVSTVGDYAFSGCGAIQSVDITGKTREIGNGAFKECTGLSSLTIPDNVTTIGDYAFSGSGLKYFSIGKGVTSVGSYPLYECENLTWVDFNCQSISKWWLNGLSNIEEIRIGEGVKIIEEEAFFGLNNLVSVGFGSQLESIGRYAFGECSKLYNLFVSSGEFLSVPSSVKSIGDGAFWKCENLKFIYIPNSITNLEDRIFEGCSNLENVSLPNSITSIGPNAFSGCIKLTSISFPQTVLSIGYSAFSGCSGLKEVTSYIIEPFELGNVFGDGVKTDEIPLYVPIGTKSKYENTWGWKDFKTIIEFVSSDINNIKNDEGSRKNIHTLSGKKIKQPQKGINIINGKKIIVK